ncbi:MAG: AI-2E family transporter [Candidatus Pacearchaeota archaeon]
MESDFKKTMAAIFTVSLLVLSFLILKPIMVSIILALILVFLFSPVYDWLYKKIGSKNLAVSLILVFLFAIIVLPIWFLTPIILTQTLDIFKLVHGIDYISAFQSVFPNIFSSEQISAEVSYAISSITTNTIDKVISSLTQIIINFPVILLQMAVVFFTFFFVLKEKESVVEYLKSILPFSKKIEKKLFKYTHGITSSILYGQFIVGIIQGIILGIGLFIFGVPSALLITVIAVFAGILPVIGTFIVWIPVVAVLFINGNMLPAWGMLIFGLISSNIDNFLRPLIVARRTEIHMAIVLVSMIGGLFFFGILGIILGPLVISYLLIFLELYRGKTKSKVIIENSEE